MTRWIILLSTSLLLSSCCGMGGCNVGPMASLPAGDGLGPDLSDQSQKRGSLTVANQTAMAEATAEQRASEQEAALARLPKNSPEWWALHDRIQAETDARLSRQLVICTGCLPPSATNKVSSTK